jgi:hypothetical protein
MESGLFEIQADHLRSFRQARAADANSRNIVRATFGRADTVHVDGRRDVDELTQQAARVSGPNSAGPAADLARCFLRLANLPSYVLDRLSRYEATLWRQAGQILFALDALQRRKPQERWSRFPISRRRDDE